MKLLVIGDSFTHGLELPDCPMHDGSATSPPSCLAWASLLATDLNYELVNLSIPGGSNSRIFRLAVDESVRNRYDLVVCQWTEISRIDWQQNNRDFPVSANSTWLHKQVPAIGDYYKNHYNDDHSMQTWLAQLITLQNHFKHTGQRYLFVSMQGLKNIGDRYRHLAVQVDPEYYIGWPHEGFTEFMGDCPKGPGGHPLELGHQRIAEHVKEYIRNLGGIS